MRMISSMSIACAPNPGVIVEFDVPILKLFLLSIVQVLLFASDPINHRENWQ